MAEIRRYPFTLTANGTILLDVVGTRFVVLSSTGELKIRPNTGGEWAGLAAGVGGVIAKGFQRLELTDTSGAANGGYILIGDDTLIYERITGEVSVIDGEKSRTLAGGRLMAGVGYQPAAPFFPQIQLWNPSSTKNAVITGLSLTTSVAATVNIFGNATALTTLTYGRISNAMIGNSVGEAVVRTEAMTGVSAPYGLLWAGDTVANIVYTPKLTGPIVIGPSKGLNVIAQLAAVGLSVNLEWYEVAAL